MPRGPKPTPTELKRLRGNPGKRKLQETDTPAFESVIPDPPAYLEGGALDEWHRLTQIMANLQIITPLDSALLASFAWVNNELAENSKALETEQRFYKSKRGAPTINWRIRYIKDLIKQQESLSDRFGASPTTRTRLKMVRTPKNNNNNPREILAEKLFNLPVTKEHQK